MSKIAVSGKGGVGKTSFASLLAYLLVEKGQSVYAIDADPNPTLGQALGFPPQMLEQVVPIVAMADLIKERTGARPGEYGGYFRMNPRVDDIPARFSVTHRGIHLMQMGTVRGAGAGCVCPENAVAKALVTHLLLREKETVIMDMVAGLEHLGRGTASAVDVMYIMVEPGSRSLSIARDVGRLADELGIPNIWAVANKVRDDRDLNFIRGQLRDMGLAGWLPLDERMIEADIAGQAVCDAVPEMITRVETIAKASGLLVDT